MSRRSRRRRGASRSPRSRWARGLAMVAGLLVVALAVGYVWLRSWLHSDDFRVMLSNAASEGLGAKSEFGRFRWDGTSVSSEFFSARGDGLVDELDADGLSLSIGLGRVRSGVVEVRDVRLNRLDVRLDLRGDAEGKPMPGAEQERPELKQQRDAWYAGLLPSEVELTGLAVARSSLTLQLDPGEAGFAGTRWEVRPEGVKGSYGVVAKGGQVALPWRKLPPLGLHEGRLRYQDLMVFLTEAEFSVYQSGRLQLSGETSLKGEGFAFEGRLQDVMAAEVLPEDWKQRLEGRLGSEFSVGDSGDGVTVDGSVELLDGTLTALPVLDHLAAYGGNPRFRRLVLSDARCDFHWKDGDLTVSNLELGSDGLIRLEGMLRMDSRKHLDGRFRLGLAPGTLARIPGAETKVFVPGERGLLWTSLRITGTADDPEEDLTDRLIAAAGERMFELLPETGERVLKFTRQVAAGDVAEAMDEGRKVIEQGGRLIDTGKAILDGDGDVVDQADEAIRQARDVVRGVDSIFGIFDDDKKVEPQEDGEKKPN